MQNTSQNQKKLWTLAFDSLNPEDKDRVKAYHAEKGIKTVYEALNTVQDKQKACMRKRWTLKDSAGRKIIVRDVLDKIAHWINKFKEIGDVAVQYDPTHASLPWAGVRFLLQVSISDLQTFTAVAEGLETISRLTARYAIFETVYLPPPWQSPTSAQSKLCEALVVYSACLKYLADVGKSIDALLESVLHEVCLNPRKVLPMRSSRLCLGKKRFEKFAKIVQTELSHKLDDSLIALKNENAVSFKSLERLMHSFEEPLLRLSGPLVLFQDTLAMEERRKMLLCLSTDHYREHHEFTYRDVIPETAEWIFSRAEYQDWQSSSSCSILWLHGMPGRPN